MKVLVKSLSSKSTSEIQLNPKIFGLALRKDILARMVNYQLAKRRSGNHKAKGISDISGTTKKPFKQKGTGRARQGSLRSPHMRGGACVFGPVVRSHDINLPKKVRRLALKIALSSKVQEGKLVVVNDLVLQNHKTSNLVSCLASLNLKSALFVDGLTVDKNFYQACSNLHLIDVLPQQGINVYSILQQDMLVLTTAALHHLEKILI